VWSFIYPESLKPVAFGQCENASRQRRDANVKINCQPCLPAGVNCQLK